jgi:cyclopropane fatty-acyl-phospholipid synthase-like methyltransferase
VTGVDFAPRAISLAKQKLRAAGVHANLQVNDATKLDGISGPFDLAFDLGCFHGITQQGQAKYLDQLERILTPGGFWLMYGFIKPTAEPSQTGRFAPAGSRPERGLAEVDISRIAARLSPISRRDGQDTARGRSSAWFLFQKHNP